MHVFHGVGEPSGSIVVISKVDQVAARSARALERVSPYVLAAVVLGLSMAVAPRFGFVGDIIDCWLPWARASGGTRPWAIYAARADCNYPPFVLYLLTGTQLLLQHVHWQHAVGLSFVLLKLPNILAYVAGGPLCAIGMRRFVGAPRANVIGCLYLLCPALLVDATVWGQYDAIVCVAMVAAVLALMHGRPVWSGALAGAALAVKLQAIVVLPALVVFAARRWGILTVIKAAAAAVLVIGVAAAPMVAGGGGRGVWAAYTGAVDYYPRLSINATNPWQLLVQYNTRVRHLSQVAAGVDSHRVLGPLTPKRLGLLAFTAYTAVLMVGLWRRPTRYDLAFAAALTAFGFFMLPTQIHERYVVPAAALLVLLAVNGCWWSFWGVSALSAANMLLTVWHDNAVRLHQLGTVGRTSQNASLIVFSLVNLWIFGRLTWQYGRRTLSSSAAAVAVCDLLADDPTSDFEGQPRVVTYPPAVPPGVLSGSVVLRPVAS